MSVPTSQIKMQVHTEFGWIAFVTFLTVFDIFDDESVISTFNN